MNRPFGAWGVGLFGLLYTICVIQVQAAEVLGTKPRHIAELSSAVPNAQAISHMIWAPGIDDAYVPQGVAWFGGAVYLSGYQSADPKVNQGPCRIFKVDAQSGRTLGQFDLPADCGHANGLVHIGDGILIASDTRRLYRIDARAAFSAEPSLKAVTATVALGGDVRGFFVHFDGNALFTGGTEQDVSKSKGHFFPLSIFETHQGKTVDQSLALRTITLPPSVQGAAFDALGKLWVSASTNRFGFLYKLDPHTGQVTSRYEMVIGMEGIAFDNVGRLWSVSEAGSLRWQRWGTTFPVLYRLDLDKVQPSP